MSLSYALLALLVDHPNSGYDLNKLFESSIGCFWKATHQQIYRELGRLEDLGWVSAELIPQSGKPDKKRYSVTELGQQALTRWIAEPTEITPVKEEILIKLFVGDRVSSSVLRQQIESQRQQYVERLVFYRSLEAKFFPDTQNLSREERLRWQTLRCGVGYADRWIAWCDEVLEGMKDEG